jgi:hypothetical protein
MLQSYENEARRDSESISASHYLTVTQNRPKKEETGGMDGVREKGGRRVRVRGSWKQSGAQRLQQPTGQRSSIKAHF